MDRTDSCNDCLACPAQVVCHCLQVTEEVLRCAIESLDLRTLHEVRRATGAGDGCTACHRRLAQYLELPLVQSSSSALAICSVK
jgi:bacterioferritin-associated ferredoxin